MNRSIIAAVGDLFFAAKIRGTAEQAGLRTIFPKTADSVCEEARSSAPHALVVLDLHAASFDPPALAARLKADERTRDLAIVGFFSHVQTELMRRARAAGVDYVVPRSVFSQNLSRILRGDFGGADNSVGRD